MKWLQSVVRGYFQYHAVPGNEERLKAFLHEVRRIWLRHASAAKPAKPLDVEAFHGATRQLATRGRDPTSVSERALRRQTSKVRTVCVSSASTGLCGGRRVTASLPRPASRLVSTLLVPGARHVPARDLPLLVSTHASPGP